MVKEEGGGGGGAGAGPLGLGTPVSPGAAKVTLRTTGELTNCAAFAVAATGVGGVLIAAAPRLGL